MNDKIFVDLGSLYAKREIRKVINEGTAGFDVRYFDIQKKSGRRRARSG